MAFLFDMMIHPAFWSNSNWLKLPDVEVRSEWCRNLPWFRRIYIPQLCSKFSFVAYGMYKPVNSETFWRNLYIYMFFILSRYYILCEYVSCECVKSNNVSVCDNSVYTYVYCNWMLFFGRDDIYHRSCCLVVLISNCTKTVVFVWVTLSFKM